ncbi:class I SAM-dependent methyltransferase [Acidihalobacter aeolianus]|uniref:class I SAM-dependent methyltransferase n=1 Tax=Acidihalobacter aeolianus TaxID=2792603 RepID=UPI000B112FE6|nr:methyltransferase domain-containing protein [Acidihalobacter aeolianus]
MDILEPEQALVEWYQGDVGRHVWARLHHEMPELLGEMFGYVGVQIGLGALTPSLLDGSRVKQRVGFGGIGRTIGVLGCPEALPFGAESLDLVILPHVLEYTQDPHQVLREVDRVLVPEGHAVFIGFNPASVWGVWAAAGRGPWRSVRRSGRAHLYTQARLKDWLALLGFDVCQVRYLMYRPPTRHAVSTDSCGWLEKWGARHFPVLGGVRIIAARKRESTLTFIKPKRRRLRVLSGSPIKTAPEVISSEKHG